MALKDQAGFGARSTPMTQKTEAQTPEDRLKQAGYTLPSPPKPVASYIPYVRTGNLLFISGQIPIKDGKPAYTGKVGDALDVETAQEAARLCVVNALAVARSALSDLRRVKRVVRAVGHVAASDGFTDVHVVTNGASDLLADVFGDSGRHSRLALGAAELPLNVPFELDLILEVE